MANFEQDLEKLEKLTQEIKKSDISLEDALKDFEEGIKLAKRMEKELDSMEAKIQILMKEPAETEEAPKSRKTKAQLEEDGTLGLFEASEEINGTRQ